MCAAQGLTPTKHLSGTVYTLIYTVYMDEKTRYLPVMHCGNEKWRFSLLMIILHHVMGTSCQVTPGGFYFGIAFDMPLVQVLKTWKILRTTTPN